jgi:hypothetical protein
LSLSEAHIVCFCFCLNWFDKETKRLDKSR